MVSVNFGFAIRDIRQKKGFSQKEIYNGIISKSYSIEFEKGKHNISTTLLIEILDRLSMDIDEFLFIYRGYLLNSYSDYIYQLSKYSNLHDVKSLNKLLNKLLEKDDLVSRVRCAEVRCRIHFIENIKDPKKIDTNRILVEDRRLIQDYLMSIETWTLQEVQLFGNTIEFLDFEMHFPLFKSLSKSLNLYTDYDKGREIFCAMLVNLITQAIKHGYLDYAEVLNQQLKLLSTSYKEFFHRTLAVYFDKVFAFKRDNHQASYLAAKEILSMILTCGQTSIANELIILLNEET